MEKGKIMPIRALTLSMVSELGGSLSVAAKALNSAWAS